MIKLYVTGFVVLSIIIIVNGENLLYTLNFSSFQKWNIHRYLLLLFLITFLFVFCFSSQCSGSFESTKGWRPPAEGDGTAKETTELALALHLTLTLQSVSIFYKESRVYLLSFMQFATTCCEQNSLSTIVRESIFWTMSVYLLMIDLFFLLLYY